ncbi:hypothetical protein Nepgr_031153 [Nepenthes gracilis]|uniref:Uncharacterized protein n=1 Tax=Nepenthes gracilis TaxID=150966 RepID=A0AAD3Y6J0_NEPGR|nr:hypothetical protein Nepgr_031153 [Nepenthes gracilis]
MADTLTVVAAQGTAVVKGLHRAAAASVLSIADSSSDHYSSTSTALQISAGICPTNAVAPPPVRSSSSRIAGRTLLKRRRRTRRRSSSSDGSEDNGFVDGYGNGGDDGLSGGGGGRGWNFDGFGSFNWDDPSAYPADPAFDFVYEVICWIVFSNCVHFAFKKVVRFVAEGSADHERESVC